MIYVYFCDSFNLPTTCNYYKLESFVILNSYFNLADFFYNEILLTVCYCLQLIFVTLFVCCGVSLSFLGSLFDLIISCIFMEGGILKSCIQYTIHHRHCVTCFIVNIDCFIISLSVFHFISNLDVPMANSTREPQTSKNK